MLEIHHELTQICDKQPQKKQTQWNTHFQKQLSDRSENGLIKVKLFHPKKGKFAGENDPL